MSINIPHTHAYMYRCMYIVHVHIYSQLHVHVSKCTQYSCSDHAEEHKPLNVLAGQCCWMLLSNRHTRDIHTALETVCATTKHVIYTSYNVHVHACCLVTSHKPVYIHACIAKMQTCDGYFVESY